MLAKIKHSIISNILRATMGNSCSSLRSNFIKGDKPIVNTASKPCTWTWRDSTEALRQSGYRFIREINTDPSVCLARYSRTDYAVCILRRYRSEVEDSGEIRFWKWLSHEHCLALYDKFADADSVYFVTDPVVGGHVSGLLEKSDVGAGEAREEFFRNVTRHALGALAAMHETGLAHLDFKWSNVWLDASSNVFLGGFVKTRSIHPPGDPSVTINQLTYGNTSSLAPEILRSIIDGTTPNMALLPKADMWALGVALVEAITDEWIGGIRLHAKSNDVAPAAVLKALIDEGGIDRVRSHLLDQGISAAAIAFITNLLKPEPSKRPLASQCLRQLWLMEKKSNEAMKDLLKISPEDAIAAETAVATIATLPKLYIPLGEKVNQFGYNIQKVLFEDVANGTVVITGKCKFNGNMVSVKAVQEKLCEKGEQFYWQQLRHDRLMQLLDSFTDSGVVFFVTNLMVLGNVEEHAKKEHIHDDPPLRREAFYRDITANMVEALCYLHQQGFAHLDFNWRHVFLHENAGAKLGGFRHLNSLQDEERPILGYMPFRAPESFIPGALRRTTLQKADMWSLGAALLQSVAQLSIGGHHFEERQIRASQRKYTFANIEDNLPRLTKALANRPRGGHSQEFQDLVISLAHFQPEFRPAAAEILNHAWLLQSSEPKPGTDVV